MSAPLKLPAYIFNILNPSLQRLELSFQPSTQIKRLRRYRFSWRQDGHFLVLFALTCIEFTYIPSKLLCVVIALAYTLALLLPITAQFVLPATPIFSWLLLFFSSRYIPHRIRPHIWVTVLPTLESVLYGANISDILTIFTHPVLDILAWLPYGVLHFAIPFFVAAALFVFGPPGSVKFFGKVFGWLNVIGVMIQIAFPCCPPWYELLYGLTPADYSMKGSAGGLARIDQIFGSNGYANTFENAPVPFGAFPSLHAGCATTEALFLSYFFPRGRVIYWSYVLLLYWSTMYLTHHYLIDLVAGASLSVLTFYLLMDDEIRAMAPNQTSPKTESSETFASSYNDPERNAAPAYKLANGSTRQNKLSSSIPEEEDYPMSDTEVERQPLASRTMSRSASVTRAPSMARRVSGSGRY